MKIFTGGNVDMSAREFNLDGNLIFSRTSNFILKENLEAGDLNLKNFDLVKQLVVEEREAEINELLLFRTVTDTYYGLYDSQRNAGFA
ncbi:MAG: hypothetical protein ACD_79C00399G0001, partial [uncultured bacterium]